MSCTEGNNKMCLAVKMKGIKENPNDKNDNFHLNNR